MVTDLSARELFADTGRTPDGPSPSILLHLARLTRDFHVRERRVSAICVYAEPGSSGYRSVAAAESGFEGVACVDDNARAAILAFDVHERTGSAAALALARRWMSLVTYMQYADGSFANFIRDWSGTRNLTAATSVRGGQWWSARARWALARAFRATGETEYLERYYACTLPPLPDGKISGLLALGEIERLRTGPDDRARRALAELCDRIVTISAGSAYLLDQPRRPAIHLWGYHQFEALAHASRVLGRPHLAGIAARTVDALIEPAIESCFWHDYPARTKEGVCAFDVSPAVRGLAELYWTTGEVRYRALARVGAAWLDGRNDAGAVMYDPASGRCSDGIAGGRASDNYGAESAIEAGFIELARLGLAES